MSWPTTSVSIFTQPHDVFVTRSEYAKVLVVLETPNTYNREQHGWLCVLINQFGEKKGISLVEDKFEKTDELMTARAMAALLHPFANCENLFCRRWPGAASPHAWSLCSSLLRISDCRG